MPGPYDAAIKQLLDTRGPDWVGWLAPLVGLPAGVTADPLDPDLSVVQPAADKVFRLRPPATGLLHLEVQSSRDETLPGRLLLYNVLLGSRYDGPVRTVVLLLRREARPGLTGVVTRADETGHVYHRFEYRTVPVWEQRADDLLAGGLGLAPLALLTDDAEPRLPEVVGRLARRVEREVPAENARGVVMGCGFQLLGMRYDEAELLRLIAGVQGMIELKDTRFYQLLADSLRNQFREEFRAEGRAEGAREALLGLLREKFGAVPPEVEARIRAEADLARLGAALPQVLRINSPDELAL
ncbi:MAG: DUF4351 domain-containing protein [Gemmataceae bacterium]|nr:DUF4351 domain-containing protein [Gemmataceae bacterium]